MFNGGALTPGKCSARFMGIVNTVLAGMNGEAARWGDGYNDYYGNTSIPPYNTADHYNTVVADKVNNYFPIRTSVVFNNLRANGYYPTLDAPEFSQHGGQVPVDYPLSITNPDGVGTIYYTTNGTDPRLTGGDVNPNAISGPSLTVSSPVHIKARIINIGEPGTGEVEWPALTEATFVTAEDPLPGEIVVSELHYHPASPSPAEQLAGYLDGDDFEFLELMNVSTGTVDISGTRLDGAVSLDLSTLADPNDRLLLPGAHLLLAGDAEAFAERYGTNIHVAAIYDGKLNNDGESFNLLLDTVPLISFIYNDKSPWPESPDGDGPSLVLRTPYGNPDHNDPLAWRPSAYFGGTPGSDGPAEPDYPADPDGDSNANGIPDLVDYAIDQPLYWSVPPGTGTSVRVSYSKYLLADQARTSIETSTNLIDWAGLPATNLATEVHHNDGTASYSLQLDELAATNDTLYLKLQLFP
ncbi:MAG: chitobiase/beta-hexosaminidase C-terminal domain-containing protein [Verrucomicrobia bacterium]|nr:chitobiase/beta-hexosaminidase C-terminal domain-containing protein [Verrucomicrobiota bacterium]